MPYIFELVIVLGLAIIAVTLFRKLNLPSVIGLLFTGVLAGPASLGLVSSPEHVEGLAEIGVVLLLFTLGIEFSFKDLLRIRRLAVGGGTLQVGGSILAALGIGLAFGMEPGRAVFLGFLAALSSTAIIIKLLMDSGEIDAPHGRASLGILIFQDLCVVPLVLFTPMLAGMDGGLSGALVTAAKAAAVLAGAHVGARYAIPWLFRHVAGVRSRELFVLTVIFVGIGTALLTAKAGLSMALGAFIAGLAISESEFSHQALGDMMPFRDAFLSIFFVSVGMLLEPAVIFDHPAAIIMLVVAIIVFKAVIAGGSAAALGLPARFAVLTGFALAQVGEFSFVLAHEGLKYELMTHDAYQLFLAASIITMSLTPYMLRLAHPVADKAVSVLPASIVAGKGALSSGEARTRLSEHVIIIGYGPSGRNLARALKHIGAPHVIIDTNPFTVKQESERGEHILFGDASRPEVLGHAGLDNAKVLVIAISDPGSTRRIVDTARKANPLVHIIVRTRYVVEMEPLYALGASEVIPEEFETSIEILARVLSKYLVDHESIEDYIADIRKDSYGMFRSMGRERGPGSGLTGLLFGVDVNTFRVKAGADLDGKNIGESMLRRRTGSIVLAVRRREDIISNPDPSWEFRPDDIVLLIGSQKQLAAASRLFEQAEPASG